VVGLKPSFGRVPQWPLGAFSAVAVAGPITRTVRDAALMLSAIARHDLRDPYALPDDPRDWRDGIEQGVAGLRIAILPHPGFDAPIDPEGIAAVEQAAQIFTAAGAEVAETQVDLPDVRTIFSRIWGVALARVALSLPPERRALLDPGLLDVAAQVGDLSALDMMEADALRIQAAHAMARLHQRYDLVLTPTVPNPSLPIALPIGNPFEALWTRWAPWTFAWNLTRQPAITVPLGFHMSGLPRSVQIAGPLYRDDLVLRAARVLEIAQPIPVPELG
jgi:aspartyl-tRNA(Asn)/glutamyl-tRNA(Gln) amidotransferase subunit A